MSVPPVPEFEPYVTPEGVTECWFYEEMWHVSLHFVTGDVTNYVRWVKRVFGCKAKMINNDASAHMQTITTKSGGLLACVIVVPGKWDTSVRRWLSLTHEAAHATGFILRARGCPHTEDTEEPYAYLQESIIRRFVRSMDKMLPAKPKTRRKKDRR